MTKQEEVWALIEAVGEDRAIAKQKINDSAKAKEYEQWFRQQVMGTRGRMFNDDGEPASRTRPGF